MFIIFLFPTNVSGKIFIYKKKVLAETNTPPINQIKIKKHQLLPSSTTKTTSTIGKRMSGMSTMK